VLCISGARDRIVARRVANAIAAHYGADHHVLEGRGHWLLARTELESVAGLVLEWLEQKQLYRGRAAV
jgi:alpha-beta hydrolase superfamily lysophospholipase